MRSFTDLKIKFKDTGILEEPTCQLSIVFFALDSDIIMVWVHYSPNLYSKDRKWDEKVVRNAKIWRITILKEGK